MTNFASEVKNKTGLTPSRDASIRNESGLSGFHSLFRENRGVETPSAVPAQKPEEIVNDLSGLRNNGAYGTYMK